MMKTINDIGNFIGKVWQENINPAEVSQRGIARDIIDRVKGVTASANPTDFAEFAPDWWDPKGPMMPLHKINPLRALYLDTKVNLAGKKLLDIGCGGGLFAEAMAERGAIVTAIDPSKELIKIAKEHQDKQKQEGKKLNINYISCELQELLQDNKSRPSSAASFDIVTCLEVLEHLEAPEDLVGGTAKLLRPDGWGYYSTINRTIRSFLLAIVGAEYVLGWLPRGTHSHSMFIQPATLCSWLEDNTLSPTNIKGIIYNPASFSFKLSDDVHTNYLLLARKAAVPPQ